MKRFGLVVVGVAVLTLGLAQATRADLVVQNPCFETSTVHPGEDTAPYFTTPYGSLPQDAVTGWTLSPTTVGANTTASGLLGAINQYEITPNGQQAVFVEKFGWVSQSIDGFVADGNTTVTFQAQGRAVTGAEPTQVLIDDTVLTFGGATTFTPTVSAMTAFTSDPVSVTAGTHTLTFVGTVGWSETTDWYTAVDDVQITNGGITSPLPEPGAMILLATGGLGLLAYAWRKRK